MSKELKASKSSTKIKASSGSSSPNQRKTLEFGRQVSSGEASMNHRDSSSLPPHTSVSRLSSATGAGPRIDSSRKNSMISQFKFKLQESIKNLSESTHTSSSDLEDDEDEKDFVSVGDDMLASSGGTNTSNQEDTITLSSNTYNINGDGVQQYSSSIHREYVVKPVNEERFILKQAYYNLMCSILDPNAHISQPHSFQVKTFTKITTCDECRSVLWGIHKQGLQCVRCNMCLHEKCLELIQIGCVRSHSVSRQQVNRMNSGSLSSMNTSSSVASTPTNNPGLPLNSPFNSPSAAHIATNAAVAAAAALMPQNPLQTALDNRLYDVRDANPLLLATIEHLFVKNGISLTPNLEGDVRQIHQDYLNKNVRKIKTKLKIFVKNAIGLIAKDSCGTSDPYVTVQCGLSPLKRTKTQKKKLNPIWNETLEFEYFNTADGIYYADSKNNSPSAKQCGNKILIRVWDEDVGIKAHFDKMLTKESDDFLGQIVLDINELNLNGEQPYELKPRSDGHPVSGYIVLSISLSLYEVGTNLNRVNENSFSFSADNLSLNSAGNVLASGSTSTTHSIASGIAGGMARQKKEPPRYSYLDQYRSLHKFVFKHLSTLQKKKGEKESSTASNRWMLKCIPPQVLLNGAGSVSDGSYQSMSLPSGTYFYDSIYNTLLKKFSNRYVIGEIQKQMIHLECFYHYFIDKHVLSRIASNDNLNEEKFNSAGSSAGGGAKQQSNRKSIRQSHRLNCQILNYMSILLSGISSAYSINKIHQISEDPTPTTSHSESIRPRVRTNSSTHIDPAVASQAVAAAAAASAGAGAPAKKSDEGKSLTALFKNDILIAPKNFQSHLNIKLNKKFLHQTCIMPNKLVLLLINYRFYYPVKFSVSDEFEIVTDNEDDEFSSSCDELDFTATTGNASVYSMDSFSTNTSSQNRKSNKVKLNAIDELKETVQLFKTSCLFIHKHLKLKTFKTTFSDRECQSLFNLSRLRRKYPQINCIEISDYNLPSQYEIIKKAIELSMMNSFDCLIKSLSSTSSQMVHNGLEEEELCLVRSTGGSVGVPSQQDGVSIGGSSLLNQNKQTRSSSSSLSSTKGKYTFNEDGSIVEIENNSSANNLNTKGRLTAQLSATSAGLFSTNSWMNHPNNVSFKSDFLAVTNPHHAHFHDVINKIETLMRLLAQYKLLVEIKLNSQYYYQPFFHSYEQVMNKDSPLPQTHFKHVCTRLLTRKYLSVIMDTVRTDADFISKLRIDHVKLHLNLFLLIKRFLLDTELDQHTLRELLEFSFFSETRFEFALAEESHTTNNNMDIDHANSINELFQPFLIEFIHEQEDQFIRYIYKIYDNDKINRLARDIAQSINEDQLYKYKKMSFVDHHYPKNSERNGGLGGGLNHDLATIHSEYDLHRSANLISPPLSMNNRAKKRSSTSIKVLGDLENYHSPSVTDLFTILHELLQTILIFDTENSDLNLPQQMCFVNLIKSKLLTYTAHIKKQYNKIYRAGSVNYTQQASKSILNSLSMLTSHHSTPNQATRPLSPIQDLTNVNYSLVQPTNELTITSCILMNNFQKTIDLLDEIQLKLTVKSELKQVVIDQLESIKVILKEDLDNMIVEYAKEYQGPFIKICQFIQVKIYNTFNGSMSNSANTSSSQQNESSSSSSSAPGGSFDLNKSINIMTNLIDETLYNMLNEKFMICKIVLFDTIFRQLLEQIFKMLVKCMEEWIILKPRGDSKSHGADAGHGSYMTNKSILSANESMDSEDDFGSGSKGAGSGGLSLFGHIGKFFYSSIANTAEKSAFFLGKHQQPNSTLLNEFQHKTLQHGLMHVIEFFSADEECLQKEYLIRTSECQSAYKTLDLYLHSSNQLVDEFIRTQNMQQNYIDFSKSFGKLRFQIEMRQSVKVKSEFVFNVKVVEARDLAWTFDYNLETNFYSTSSSNSNGGQSNHVNSNGLLSTSAPYIDIYLFGPYVDKRWRRKLIRHAVVDMPTRHAFFKETGFDFRLNLTSAEMREMNMDSFLSNYELQIVLCDSNCPKQFKVNGVAVFNLNLVTRSASVWKKLRLEDEKHVIGPMTNGFVPVASESNHNIGPTNEYLTNGCMYGCMELWLAMRGKLRVNEQGNKILKVLERYVDDKRASEFIQLKLLSRHTNKIYWN